MSIASLEKENEELKKVLQVRTEDLTAAILQSTEAKVKLEQDNDVLRQRIMTLQQSEIYEELQDARALIAAQIYRYDEYVSEVQLCLLQRQMFRHLIMKSFRAFLRWKIATTKPFSEAPDSVRYDPYQQHFGAPPSRSDSPPSDNNYAANLRERLEETSAALEVALSEAKKTSAARAEVERIAEEDMKTASEKMEAETERLRKEHVDALEQLKLRHALEVEAARTETKSSVEGRASSVQTQLSTDLEALRMQLVHANSVAEARQQDERALEAQLSEAHHEIATLQQRIEEANAKAANLARTEASMRKKTAGDISLLKEEHSALLQQSSAEAAVMRERMVQQMNELKRQHQHELEEFTRTEASAAREKMEAETERLRKEHGDALEQLKLRHALEVEAARTETKSSVEGRASSVQTQLSTDLEALRMQLVHANSVAEARQQDERALEAQLSEAHHEIATLQQRIEEANAKAANLARTEASMRKKTAGDISLLKEEHSALLQQSSAEAAVMRERMVQQMNELKRQHQHELEEFTRTEASAAREKMEAETERLRKEHGDALEQLKRRHALEIRDVQASIARAESNVPIEIDASSACAESVTTAAQVNTAPRLGGGSSTFLMPLQQAPELSSEAPSNGSSCWNELDSVVLLLQNDLAQLKKGLVEDAAHLQEAVVYADEVK